MERTLSAKEAKIVLELEWRDQKILTLKEIQQMLGCKNGYARVLAHSLVTKRWLEKLGGGKYLFIPAARGLQAVPSFNPLLIGGAFVHPYYFSYATSNHYYGFSTQIPSRIYIACLKAKKGVRIRQHTFHFVHLKAEKFFGYQTVKVFQDEVQMADREKSVVDSLDKLSYAGGIAQAAAVIHQAQRSLDWEKLAEVALRMDAGALVARLGFLLQTLDIQVPPHLIEPLQSRIGATKTYLAPIRRWGKEGTYNKTWQVICNVPEEVLFSEIAIH